MYINNGQAIVSATSHTLIRSLTGVVINTARLLQMDGRITIENIRAELEVEYGKPDKQDQHIDVFYVRVGNQIAEDMADNLEFSDPTSGDVQLWSLTSPVPGLFYGVFPKQGQVSERE